MHLTMAHTQAPCIQCLETVSNENKITRVNSTRYRNQSLTKKYVIHRRNIIVKTNSFPRPCKYINIFGFNQIDLLRFLQGIKKQ